MNSQKQQSGDSSVNIQAGVLNVIGITEDQAHQIAIDVFHKNFLSLSSIAAETARTRAEEITRQFIEKLIKQNKDGLNSANDPDFQYSLFTIQKEYAKTGDKQLGDLLVDILVDRTKYSTRSIIQIVLNESLSIAPKLTDSQLSVISILFLLKYTTMNGINNLKSLKDYFEKYFKPFSRNLTKSDTCYQHIVYTGVGSLSIVSLNICSILKNKYEGLFSKGFTESELLNRQISLPILHPIFTRCLHDLSKYQVNAIDEDMIRSKSQEHKIQDQDITKLTVLQKTFLMNESELKQYIIANNNFMEIVINTWQESFMKNMSLTSVGIAIAHANIKKSLGEFTDLSIWIN